jgi:hypothetical protein
MVGSHFITRKEKVVFLPPEFAWDKTDKSLCWMLSFVNGRLPFHEKFKEKVLFLPPGRVCLGIGTPQRILGSS